MFNIIKGGFVNKDAKPVIIKPKTKIVGKKTQDNENSTETIPFDETAENELNSSLSESEETLKQSYSNNKEELEEDAFKDFEIDEKLLAKREELERITKEIEHMKLKAEQDVRDIVEDAKLKAELESNSVKSEAWDTGYNEGLEAGKKQILLNSSNIFANVQNVLEEALKQKDILVDEYKDEIISLIFKISEKIVKKEIEAKDVLRNNLLEAFKYVSTSKKITLYINWNQIELVEELKEELKSKFYSIEEFNILEDKNLLPGGCIIETKMGRIDASIETQLESVFEILKN